MSGLSLIEENMTSISISDEALAQMQKLLSKEADDSCIRLRTYNIGSG